LLQKSKIERRRKTREGRFLDATAAARLAEANTKVGGRFDMKRCGPSGRRARSASAAFKTFVLHPKNTFATISTLSEHWTSLVCSEVIAQKAMGSRRDNTPN
jgi:hypothetical protein